jgi:hypothetical protein
MILTLHFMSFLHSTSWSSNIPLQVVPHSIAWASHAPFHILSLHFMSFLHPTSHDSYTPLHKLLTFHFTRFTTESNQQFSLFSCNSVSPSNRNYSHTPRQNRQCLSQSSTRTIVTNCWITKYSGSFTVKSFRFPSCISGGSTCFAIAALCAGDASNVNRGNIKKKTGYDAV